MPKRRVFGAVRCGISHEWLGQIACRVPNAGLEIGPRGRKRGDDLVSRFVSFGAWAEGGCCAEGVVEAVAGHEVFVELPEASWCCGSAGIYSITQPEQSGLLLERKIGHIVETGASILATANPGCHLQLVNGLKARGVSIEVAHPMSLLARAYRNEVKNN